MNNANLLFKQFRVLTIEFGGFVRVQKLFSIIILTSILTSAFSVAAQTVNRGSQGKSTLPTVQTSTKGAKRPAAKVPVVSGGAACKGGWSGVINYSQTLDDSGSENNKSERGESSKQWSRNINYQGTMIVDGSDPKAVATNGTVNLTDVKRENDVEKSIDRCSAWKPEHEYVWDRKLEEIRTGSGSGAAESFFLYVDEARGTYKLSFTLPDVPGKYNREEHVTRSGWCQPKNNEPIDFSESNTDPIKGGGGTAENQKIDPSQPDVLEGSRTIDINDKNSTSSHKAPVITFSWRLRRCPPPLMITDVKFYHLNFPSPNTWEEVDNRLNHYTIDGNDVKIVATIVNLSGAKKSATVNFKDLTDNKDLPEASVPASFEPHEEKQVEYIWDTSGYAWKESSPENYAVNSRNIEVRVPDDRKSEAIFIYPKPVVLIPGMWSKPEKFVYLASYFKNENVPWATVVPPVLIKKTAASNAQIIDKSVREIQERVNAWHVDLVAHSTGGLMARAYVDGLMPTQYDNRPTALHLVMLGTPNLGTPCSTGVSTVMTKIFNRNEEAFDEISPKNMLTFNERVTRRNGTKFLAVVSKAYTPTCQLDEAGDGIVPWISAVYKSKTYAYTNSSHEDMGGDRTVFPHVRKWLALTPSTNFAPDNSAGWQNFGGNHLAGNNEEPSSDSFGAVFRPASFQTTNFPTSVDDEPNFATGILLAANQSSEIEIPVTNGSRFSLILYAPPSVSATLLDERGEIVGRNLAGSPEAAQIFRTITVKKPFNNGKWKLRLENREKTEAEIIITAFIDFSSAVRKESNNQY